MKTQMKFLGSSMIGLLKKVDPTFEIRQDQRCTAVNSKGFEIDIIRREALEGDSHPLRLSEDEDDFWAVQAKRADVLLSGPRFSAMDRVSLRIHGEDPHDLPDIYQIQAVAGVSTGPGSNEAIER